jgi:phosphate transport system permease protein
MNEKVAAVLPSNGTQTHRSTPPNALGQADLDLSRLANPQRRPGEFVVKSLLRLAAFVSVGTTVGIVVSLLRPSIDFFSSVGFREFFLDTEWSPTFEPAHFGARPLLTATLIITLIAVTVAIPLGLGAAIFLSEYASPRVRKFVKPLLEILAGVPTVVYGFFALTFVTPNILQKLPGLGGATKVNVYNALSAGLVMGFMILPTVASLSEDAMSAVPTALRQGSLALGANKFQTTVKVILPAALSGLIASFILAISRAIGETMVVTVAAGAIASSAVDPRNSMQTITSFIAQIAQGDVPNGTVIYKTLFALGLTLFLITLTLNAISIRLVRRFREVYE